MVMMVMTIMMKVIDIHNDNTNYHYHHESCAGELVQVVSLCIIQTRAGIKHLKVITLSTRNIIIIIFSTAVALVVKSV